MNSQPQPPKQLIQQDTHNQLKNELIALQQELQKLSHWSSASSSSSNVIHPFKLAMVWTFGVIYMSYCYYNTLQVNLLHFVILFAFGLFMLLYPENDSKANSSSSVNEQKNVLKLQLDQIRARLLDLQTHPHEADEALMKVPSHQVPKEVVERKEDLSIAFSEQKSYPIEHMRLNMFAGITCISFQEDVLNRLTAEEQQLYQQLKNEMTHWIAQQSPEELSKFEQLPDEFTMLRFLQADDYNISAAVTRLINCLNWRHTFGIDRFIESPTLALLKRYRRIRVRRIVGIDRSGRILVIERLGEFIASEESFKGGLTMEQWIMFYAFDLSELMAAFRECSERTGKYTHRINFIGDLSGARLAGAFRLMAVLKVVSKIIEVAYPEVAGNIILINAPSFAGACWSVVKKFLDPKTVSKISILVGPCPDVLRKTCGEAVLPVEFGGTNEYILPHPVQKIDARFNQEFPLE
jgi:hypothetical protein